MKMSKVGNQTNSQDPQAVNSRVFVGNLNTFQCSKTDVERMFQRYGRLAGISMHKGYAFVQFTNPFDARSACLGEDGRTVLSQILGKLLYYSTNDNLAVLRANFNLLVFRRLSPSDTQMTTLVCLSMLVSLLKRVISRVYIAKRGHFKRSSNEIHFIKDFNNRPSGCREKQAFFLGKPKNCVSGVASNSLPPTLPVAMYILCIHGDVWRDANCYHYARGGAGKLCA
ncbi:hypothetical protein HZH66_015291 [Vespula vulgaris]|uniref:RRM domain-containing protein n=1 Tax=Vespula vulgaris TaxID=7454 RepID=A0A834IZD6_VESVU|nr:hypothetical protein HZH66_015291 [Vespula vulgaris]